MLCQKHTQFLYLSPILILKHMNKYRLLFQLYFSQPLSFPTGIYVWANYSLGGTTLRKKRYKSCHWGCTFLKGKLLSVLVANMYISGANMYILGANKYILSVNSYILGANKYILGVNMYILGANM